MPVETYCPACGTAHRFKDADEGKRVGCKSCGKPFVVAGAYDRADEVAEPTRLPPKKPASGCANMLVLLGLIVAAGYGMDWLLKLQRKARADIVAAHKDFEQGKKAEAVAVYKDRYPSALDADKVLIIKRVAEHEAGKGDEAEARRWIEKGLKAKLAVSYEGAAAQVHARAKMEHDFDEAEKAKKRDENANGVLVAAQVLWQEYQLDPAAADGRYKGKLLRITGSVNEVFPPDEVTRAVTVHMDPFAGNVVSCWFSGSDGAALRAGQQVTIKGRCRGLLPAAKEVRIESCSVVP